MTTNLITAAEIAGWWTMRTTAVQWMIPGREPLEQTSPPGLLRPLRPTERAHYEQVQRCVAAHKMSASQYRLYAAPKDTHFDGSLPSRGSSSGAVPNGNAARRSTAPERSSPSGYPERPMRACSCSLMQASSSSGELTWAASLRA